MLSDTTPHFLPKPVAALPPETDAGPPAPAASERAPADTGELVKVANTGGVGAILRAEPPRGRQIATLRDGHLLTVLEHQNLPDGEWLRVRSEQGMEGWIFARLVGPTRGSPTLKVVRDNWHPDPRPVPQKQRVLGDQADAAVAAGDAELVARLPVVFVERLAVGAEVLGPAHVFDSVVGALGVEADQAGGVHRLVLDAPLDLIHARVTFPTAGRPVDVRDTCTGVSPS